ncbi:Zinc finger, RING/FYVE/PHD-type [Sergentomyia squamirostris]
MGTNASTSSSTSTMASSENNSLFERIFVCPICFEKYSGNIMQCQSGHSVCEICFRDVTQCPQCRGNFIGTRNYIMEDFILELGRMKISPEKAMEAVLKCAKDQQMSSRVMSEPLRSFSTPENDDNETETEEDFGIHVEELIINDLDRRTNCMMENCDERPEHSEIEQHLFTKHMDKTKRLRASAYFSKSHFGMVIPCLPARFAFITEFGTFFLIIRTVQTSTSTKVSAWVQGACENSEATLFYFWLTFHVNDSRAVFHDYVHGSGTPFNEIEGQNQCLMFCAEAQPFDRLFIKGYICLNNRRVLHPRHTVTFTKKCDNSDLLHLCS